ncbi:hypothetical protein EVAR_66328_1 [Eumeta japonica]|uniref:Uncharacterized protein n=1 Tax=Eumeta variegata TaxID=151549 RepID=A0A4C1Z3I3_EUMVA|nr:hypothetical protein EVAR_66328_1 [Eumeta japonica]
MPERPESLYSPIGPPARQCARARFRVRTSDKLIALESMRVVVNIFDGHTSICEPSEHRWSSPSLGTRNTPGVTSVLAASWVGIENSMEGEGIDGAGSGGKWRMGRLMEEGGVVVGECIVCCRCVVGLCVTLAERSKRTDERVDAEGNALPAPTPA